MTEQPPRTETELVELVRSIDVSAPQELHRRIDALVAARTSPRWRRPVAIRWGACAALALAAVVAVLAASLSGGGSALTLRSTVALTMRPATSGAPAENPHDGTQLAAAVDGVAFPYWEESFGWRSTGARTDRVGGRTVTTVFYAGHRGQWIGYAIVAGTPPPHAGGSVVAWRHGTPYRLSVVGGARVVTWLRHGHLCVVAGHGVSDGTLLSLASWRGHDTLAA